MGWTKLFATRLYVITRVFRAIPQFAIACKDRQDLGGARCSRRERYSRGGQTWNEKSKSGPTKGSQLSWSDNFDRMQYHESPFLYSLTLPLQHATTLAPSWELDPDLLVHELAWGQTLICAQLLAMQRQQRPIMTSQQYPSPILTLSSSSQVGLLPPCLVLLP